MQALPTKQRHKQLKARRSPIAEGPRDALCQLKFCQLLHSSTDIHISKVSQ